MLLRASSRYCSAVASNCWFARFMTSRMFARFIRISLVCFTRISLLASEPWAIAQGVLADDPDRGEAAADGEAARRGRG